MNRWYLAGILLVFFIACRKPAQTTNAFLLKLPDGFESPEIPADNPLTQKKAELGQLLFFDPIISDDSSISCSSCHIPEHAFTDTNKVAIGIKGQPGNRNSPSLVNVAYYPYFFMEGRVKDLETQAQAPGLHAAEMGTELKSMIFRLRKNSFYRAKFKEVFGTDTLQLKHFVYAIASYERTLIAANNRFFRYKYGSSTSALTPAELLGMNLFFSDRTNCSQCHNGNLFTDFSFQSIGLEKTYTDPGLARATSLAKDSGLFKTPSLLNVEYTAPYMHNGSIATLEEVVDLYNSGGKDHPNKSRFIQPLHLTTTEKQSLVAFLKTLTDEDLKQKTGIFATPVLKYGEK